VNRFKLAIAAVTPAIGLIVGTLPAPFISWAAEPPPAPEKSAVQARSREGGLTQAEFERLHRKLVKMSTEQVWSIPWHVSIREAREQAAKKKKPLLLWCTNNGGTNPLGPC
jgi:hypothetical protein